MPTYDEFIQSKRRTTSQIGFEPEDVNPNLFDWQRDVVLWACRRGRAALFEDCGLGKTIQQLEWARQVCRKTGGKVLIHAPVGVRSQTVREAAKFNIECDVRVADDDSQVGPDISICNYEKLHKIDPAQFAGVVLDESSILKSYTGATKRALLESWKATTYRLACTATPAPNDLMELGNHAEFLGVMPSNEMLSRWFINDTMKAGGYRLKGHATDDYWRWVATWAVSIETPSDVGGSDRGFVLPELIREDHIVEESAEAPPGMLFNNYGLSATNVHRQKRSSCEARAARVAELVKADADECWLMWCDTNYEADELLKRIPGSVDIRGSESNASKESKLSGFSDGSIKRLVTKPTIAGFGMNWQHCNHVAFVGLSYSYEQYYQAIRRCWRFGQQKPVHSHVVMSEGEFAIAKTVEQKERQHRAMSRSMADSMREFTQTELAERDTEISQYRPTRKMEIPEWLR